MDTLAIVEGGRIYDDEEGYIIFEPYEMRKTIDLDRVKTLPEGSVYRSLDMDNLIVNSVDYELDGAKVVNHVTEDDNLPVTLRVPPREVVTWRYPVDNPVLLTTQWTQPIAGIHYDYELVGRIPRVRYGDDFIELEFTNDTDFTALATIHFFEAMVLERSSTATILERNERSIRRYGRKSAIYPKNVVADDADARGRAAEWVQHWGGFADDGLISPIIPLEVEIKDFVDSNFHAKISDLVYVNWITRQARNSAFYPAWVDSVKYTLDSDNTYTMTLRLQSALHRSELPEVPFGPPIIYGPRIPGERTEIARFDLPSLRRRQIAQFVVTQDFYNVVLCTFNPDDILPASR